ncbi:MAG TPA: MASE1 domain-containing protein [Pyrinomonadaceae bacterium]|nr:MASE1 domain-containing protein [Pyrinomonadaceae bacterium]
MNPTAQSKNSSKLFYRILTISGVAVVYFAAAELGLSLAFIHDNVSPVWPPTGVAVAALLLLGYRVWPGVLIGAYAANVLTPIPIGSVLGIAAGNTLEALTAVFILRHAGFNNSFDRAKQVVWFLAALTVGTMVAASIGNVSLCLGGAASWEHFGSLWLTWWLGDLVGGLVVAPLILTWTTISQPSLKARWAETLLLFTLLSLTSMVLFGGWFPSSVQTYPLAHLAFPFLIWAAFRLGQRGVTASLFILASIAIWGTRQGYGAFALSSPNESLLLVQAYIGSTAIMCLFLVASIEERYLANTILRESERRLGGNLGVTRILAESPALSDATPRILQTICETLNWELGGLWVPDTKSNQLECLAFWHSPQSNAEAFEEISLRTRFEPGVGLPGRVWSTMKPAWIPDVGKDDNFPRGPYSKAAGLHAAFAFPILFRSKFLGVMEFFSYEIRQPDNALLAMFGSIGGQIGQFLERKRNEEEREQLLAREFAARAEAERANRTKDEFLAIVSHELRTPLNAIVGWASMLRSGSLDPARKTRAIEVIDRNAKAQAQLIEDILDVSRIVSGNLRLSPRPVQLQQVIEAAVDSIRPASDAKQISLSVELDKNAGSVSGDPDRLQQVVWNLLSNAVKFTPSGGEVSVELKAANSHAEIIVSDNGTGIPAEFLPHVFDRFRQADGSKTRRHGGLGLGLAIVRNLVELHGGAVQVHSDGEGKGTSFVIKLPCAGGLTQPPGSQSQLDASRLSNDGRLELSGMRILTVEDDADSREMLEMVLKSQGAEVTSVSCVNDALTILQSNGWQPHIVVSDLGMPERDGYDLIREIRSGSTAERLPAIAITGYAGNDEGKRALDAGFQRHLSKPVNWRELIDAIVQLAGRKM